nr:ribosomal protein L23 [Neoscirpus dioicus]
MTNSYTRKNLKTLYTSNVESGSTKTEIKDWVELR